MKVKIYFLVDVFYYAYYIEGFYRLCGKNKVEFSRKEFPAFPERTFAAIIESGNKKLKIVIDAYDTPRISPKLLEWCDVYAKVNFNDKNLPSINHHKIIPIGPSFGIKIWSMPKTVYFAFSNYMKSKGEIHFKRNFFANYWRQYKRLQLKEYYINSSIEDNYVYFISSLWKKEKNTNLNRADFILACKELEGVKFEGGFAPRSDGNSLGLRGFVNERISLKEYLKRIKESFVVFNTPAVEDCFGWKLAEYLALGKAIISTQNYNMLPASLVHGQHLHYVYNVKGELKLAIEKLRLDPEYRIFLEKNSRKYFLDNLLPEVVVKKLIKEFL